MSPQDVLVLLNSSGDTVSLTTRRETINNFGKHVWEDERVWSVKSGFVLCVWLAKSGIYIKR